MTSGRLCSTVTAVALLYVATTMLMPARGFWIIDNGNKIIQVQALLSNGFSDFSIPWPGRTLDPDLELNPLPSPFSTVRDAKLYSIFSPTFPAISSLCYAALGDRGLYLLPLVFGIAMLAGLVRITRRAKFPEAVGHLTVIIAGLCTPIWFYSAVFWEHVPAASLCVWSVAFLLEFLENQDRRSLIASGLCCAVAIWFRDQLVLFAAVLGLIALLSGGGHRLRTASTFGAGLLVGLLPLACFQALALGNPLGLHLAHGFHTGVTEPVASQVFAHLRDRPQAIYALFLASAGERAPSLLIALPFLLLLFTNPRLPRDKYVVAVLAAAVWALAGTALIAGSYATASSPIRWLLESNGLYAAAPVLLLAFTCCRDFEAETPAWRARCHLWRITALYACLYALLTPLRNTGGIHWGNRYLLILYPLLAVLCAANLVDLYRALVGSPRLRPALVLLSILMLASFSLQLCSLELLHRKRTWSQRVNEAVHERPEEIIITRKSWVPQELAWEFPQRKIFFLSNRAQFDRLVERMKKLGETRYLVVSSVTGDGAGREGVVSDNGLNFFSLRLVSRRIEGTHPATPVERSRGKQ